MAKRLIPPEMPLPSESPPMTPARSFSEALVSTPLFFEPVPPMGRSPAARVTERVEAIACLVREVPRLDALDVPELVDENHEGRPRYRSGDIRPFAVRLQEATERPAVINRIVAHVASAPELERWATETTALGLRHVVLVGGASRFIPYPGPSVADANRLCRPIFRDAGGSIGNIAIPQRVGEPHRMLSKTRVGASFFTTQILFDGDRAVDLVRQYAYLCRQASIPPATVLLGFAPVADDQDVEFVRWLGAEIPETIEQMLLEEDEAEVLRRSEARAIALWETVRATVAREELEVPLGVNVEQVSSRHLDAAAHLLREFARRIDSVPSAGPGTEAPDPSPGRSAPSGSTV